MVLGGVSYRLEEKNNTLSVSSSSPLSRYTDTLFTLFIIVGKRQQQRERKVKKKKRKIKKKTTTKQIV